MIEDSIYNVINEVDNYINLIKIKLKNDKKELKQIDKQIKDNKYIDNEIVTNDKTRLNKEISELDIRLYKLNKILYRLKVCEKILNNEE